MKKRRPLTEEQKKIRREKAARTRAKTKEKKQEFEHFRRYVDEKARKFEFVENFKRPYRKMFRGWTEEESYKNMKENVDEFRKSFEFEDFRNGIFKEDELDKQILDIRKIRGEEIRECNHKFVQMIPSHQRVCAKCAVISTNKIFCPGSSTDFKGKSYSTY